MGIFTKGVRARYRRPMEVAYHSRLPAQAKKSILADWACADTALRDDPFLHRDPRTGLVASLDEIAEAQRALEEELARRERALNSLLGALPRVEPLKLSKERVASRLNQIRRAPAT